MTDFPELSRGSVSQLLGGLRQGDEAAVGQLWHRYFAPLVRLARGRLSAGGGSAQSAEDVALEAFWSLCKQAASPESASRFPQLDNRKHLWRLLACFTARRAIDLARKETRQRLLISDESALGADGFEPFAGREPPAEFGSAVADLLESLPTEELRRVALARLEGWTNEEIARSMGRSLATVERKLQVIRTLWRHLEGGTT